VELDVARKRVCDILRGVALEAAFAYGPRRGFDRGIAGPFRPGDLTLFGGDAVELVGSGFQPGLGARICRPL
jgi:hypothetical protein